MVERRLRTHCRAWTRGRRRRWTIGLLVGLTAPVSSVLLGVPPAPVAAVEVVSIPIDHVTNGSEGELVLVATVEVPTEFVGQACTITGITDNQESVHQGNDLLIVNGPQMIVITDFEDDHFIVHETSGIEALAQTIELFVRFGPDGISSGGFRVNLDCPDEPTPTPSTTVPPTTNPPTTNPPTSAPTTTAPSALAPPSAGPPSMAPPTSAPPPLPPGDDQPGLPVTGASSILVGLIGLFVACVGVALHDWSRTSEFSHS